MKELDLGKNPMETQIFWSWEVPQHVEGPAVMFDVIAASANIAILITKAKRVFLSTKDGILNTIEQLPHALLVGETDDETLYKELAPRFAGTNSPAKIINAPIDGRDVILISNNGTHTIAELLEKGAKPVIAASYVNLRTVTQWLLQSQWEKVTLVPSGGREQIFAANPKLPEDIFCAEAMRDLISSKPRDINTDLIQIREQMTIAYAHHFPSSASVDITLTPIDTYPVVPICKTLPGGLIEATRAV